MLKSLRRYAKQMEIIIHGLPEQNGVVELLCSTPESTSEDILAAIEKLYEKYGEHVEETANPTFCDLHQPNVSHLELPVLVRKAFAGSCSFTRMQIETGAPLVSIWGTFLGLFSALLGYTLIHIPSESNSSKRLFLYRSNLDIDELRHTFSSIEKALGISLHAVIHYTDVTPLKKALFARLDLAKKVYTENEDTEWVQDFFSNLGDDLSRISLLNFLKQRMFAKIFLDSDAFYTVLPPVESGAWRNTRLRENHSIPSIEPSHVKAIPFFNLTTFILEQYAIPGLITAKEGDTVLDAGACYGDTALYFSEKVSDSGHVYAFEPLSSNVRYLERNLAFHKCQNVTVVPFALGSEERTGKISVEETISTIESDENSDGEVIQITTIDSFAADKRIDFIKADIEGAELDMLQGAAKTIARDKPLCALTIYHKEDDYKTLPKYLESLNPRYVFYIRCDAEPVVFAVNHLGDQ